MGDTQPAAHPAGKGPDLFIAGLLQTDHMQEFPNLGHGLGTGHPFQHRHIQKEITGTVLRISDKILGQIAQFVPVCRAQCVNGNPIQTYLSGSGLQDAADHPQKGCFSRPVGSQQTINTGFQHSRDPCHRRVSSELLAQIFKQQFHR